MTFFQLDTQLPDEDLATWAASLTGLSDDRIEIVEGYGSGSDGIELLVRRREEGDGLFRFRYELRAARDEVLPASKRAFVDAVEHLVSEHDCWASVGTDDRQQYRSLLVTPEGTWYRQTSYQITPTRERAWEQRINRPLGVVCVPGDRTPAEIEGAVTENLDVDAGLTWSGGQVHPYGLSRSNRYYDWELIDAHLQDPREARPAKLLTWTPLEEEIERWLAAVQAAARALDTPLYAYHRNFSETRNIPGGSDDEAYCVRMDWQSRDEIRFKRCRESW